MTKSKEFIPTEFGWVSHETPPTEENRDVVVLVWCPFEEMYLERIGYFGNQKWNILSIKDDVEPDNFEVRGWFPYPYTPHNK